MYTRFLLVETNRQNDWVVFFFIIINISFPLSENVHLRKTNTEVTHTR